MHQNSTNSNIFIYKLFMKYKTHTFHDYWFDLSHISISLISLSYKILLNDQEKSQVKSSLLFGGTGVVESVEALHTKDKWVWNSIDTRINHSRLWIIESSSNPSNYECLDRSSSPPDILGEDSIVYLHWQLCSTHYNITVTIKCLNNDMYYKI